MSLLRTILCVSLYLQIITVNDAVMMGQNIEKLVRIPRGNSGLLPATGGPRSSILFDSCSGYLYSISGGWLLRSGNLGKTWERIAEPQHGTNLGGGQLELNGCQLWCKWESGVSESRYKLAVLTDSSWRLIDSSHVWPKKRTYTASSGSLVVILSNDGKGAISLSYSWDAGDTFNSLSIPDSLYSSYEDAISKPGLGTIAVVCKNRGVIEFNADSKSIRIDRVPSTTVRYKYFNKEHLISTQLHYNRDNGNIDSSTLSISSNGGSSWRVFNIIKDSRTGQTIHGMKDALHIRWLSVSKNGACTAIFANGLVASSKDYGENWIFNGFLPHDFLKPGTNQVSLTNDGTLYCIVGRDLFALENGDEELKIISMNSPRFHSLCALSKSDIVGQTTQGCYFTSDGGKNWYLSEYTSSFYEGHDTFTGVSGTKIESMTTVGDTLFINCPETESVLSYCGKGLRFEFNTGYYLSNTSLLCDDDRYTMSGPPRSQFTGYELRGHEMDFLTEYSENGSTHTYPPHEVEGVSFYAVMPAGDTIVVADSVYVKNAKHNSWIPGGIGLPREGKNISAVSTIYQISDSLLLLGFRGCSVVSNGEGHVVTGGLYYSTDLGILWQQSKTDYEYNSFVWDVDVASDLTMYATVSQVANTSGGMLMSTNSAILASTHNGLDWHVVHRFENLQRVAAYTGNRIAVAGDGTVYALGDNEVVYSTDHGNTWQTFTNEFMLTGCLTDIAAGSDNRVYVGTTQGVFIYDAITDVAGDDDHLRYTSVWLYPTPTHGVATIRVNNLDLVDVSQCSLTLYNQYGDQCADLSSKLLGHAGQRRMEFTYETTHLPPGLYILVLHSPNGVVENYKMMVVR